MGFQLNDVNFKLCVFKLMAEGLNTWCIDTALLEYTVHGMKYEIPMG